MTRYRHKPQEVTAVQWRGDNRDEVQKFLEGIGAEEIMFDADRPEYHGNFVAFVANGEDELCDERQWIVAFHPDAHEVGVWTDDLFRRDFDPEGEKAARSPFPPEPADGSLVMLDRPQRLLEVWHRNGDGWWQIGGQHQRLGYSWASLHARGKVVPLVPDPAADAPPLPFKHQGFTVEWQQLPGEDPAVRVDLGGICSWDFPPADADAAAQAGAALLAGAQRLRAAQQAEGGQP